jgi:hypothetical protein
MVISSVAKLTLDEKQRQAHAHLFFSLCALMPDDVSTTTPAAPTAVHWAHSTLVLGSLLMLQGRR